MENEKENFKEFVENIIHKISLIQTDKDIQESMKKLLEMEIDLYEFLLALEAQKAPRSGKEFGKLTEEKLKMSWKDWIWKFIDKLNAWLPSLVSK